MCIRDRTYPDGALVRRALQKVPFLAVVEQVLTETASLADVVFAAASFAEKRGHVTNLEGRTQAFAQAIELFYQPPRHAPGIHPTAIIAKSARIAEGAHIGPYCFVDEEAVIGRNAVLHSFVTIYRGAKIGDNFFAHAHAVVREFCSIGNRVILQNGVVIGGDGFGFAKQKDGTWHKMVQAGLTVLEDDVEVQANSCVDRATVGETRVGRGSKLDDMVLVGHGSRIGANTLLCGQVGLAGSTKVGSDCILAGQVLSLIHI